VEAIPCKDRWGDKPGETSLNSGKKEGEPFSLEIQEMLDRLDVRKSRKN